MSITATAFDGTAICEPGIYADVPMDRYHGDPTLCSGPSISSTGLRTILADGPASYWIRSHLNPQRLVEPEKAHFALGRAAHTLILGEAGFAREYAVHPVEYPAKPRTKGGTPEMKPWHRAAEYCKAWERERIDAGLTIISPAQLDQIKGMAGILPWQRDQDNRVPESGLANSALVAEGLLEGDVERTIAWKDEETGVWLRARPDLIPRADKVVVNLKTFSRGDPLKAIWDHAYHMSEALVAEGLRAVAGVEAEAFVFVFVETTPPHRVVHAELTAHIDPATGEEIDPIERGMRANRMAIRTFARCLERREWPAATGDVVPAHMPGWLVRQDDRNASPDAQTETAITEEAA